MASEPPQPSSPERENERLLAELAAADADRLLWSDLYLEAPFAYLVLDDKGIILRANKAAIAVLAHDAAILGKPFIAVVNLEDAAVFSRHLRQCLEGRGRASAELVFTSSSGQQRMVRVMSSSPETAFGRRLIYSALLEISELQQTERELRRAHALEQEAVARVEALYRASAAVSQALTELPTIGFGAVLECIAEQARHLVDAELVVLGLLGRGQAPFEQFAQSGLRPEAAAMWRGMSGEAVVRLVGTGQAVRARAPDLGGLTELPAPHPPIANLLALPIRHLGKVLGVVLLANKRLAAEFSEDDERRLLIFTDRAALTVLAAKASDAEAHQRAWLQAVVDQMPEAVLVIDAEDKLTENRQALALQRGKAWADPFGNRIRYEMRTPAGEEIPWEEGPLMRAFLHDERASADLLLVTDDDRQVPVLASAAPIHADDGHLLGAVAVFQRIEHLKHLERLREEWSAIVAHDLRQPLTAITLWGHELTDSGEKSPESRAKAVAGIARSVTVMSRMVEDLLDLSLLEAHRLSLKRETQKLDVLLRDMAEQFSRQHPQRPVRAVADPLPPVEYDPARIEQVLVNLLSNAVKYGKPGSPITVTGEVRGDTAEVTVINEGGKLTPQEAENLFARFYRTPSAKAGAVRGLGLGLYIARGLVEAHGGRMWAESIGGRTFFHFSLPLRQASSDVHAP